MLTNLYPKLFPDMLYYIKANERTVSLEKTIIDISPSNLQYALLISYDEYGLIILKNNHLHNHNNRNDSDDESSVIGVNSYTEYDDKNCEKSYISSCTDESYIDDTNMNDSITDDDASDSDTGYVKL